MKTIRLLASTTLVCLSLGAPQAVGAATFKLKAIKAAAQKAGAKLPDDGILTDCLQRLQSGSTKRLYVEPGESGKESGESGRSGRLLAFGAHGQDRPTLEVHEMAFTSDGRLGHVAKETWPVPRDLKGQSIDAIAANFLGQPRAWKGPETRYGSMDGRTFFEQHGTTWSYSYGGRHTVYGGRHTDTEPTGELQARREPLREGHQRVPSEGDLRPTPPAKRRTARRGRW